MIIGGAPGEQVRLLRERAGLTIEQLASSAGIEVDRLTAIEGRDVDPGVSEFQRLAVATGHRAVTGLTRQLRAPDDARVLDILHEAVSRLLAVTEPAAPLPAAGLTGWRRAVLGLFLVARESVREMLLLDALGHSYHAGPLIDRSVFEDVATALWVADDPSERDARFRRVVQDRNFYLEKLADHDPQGWGEIVDAERKAWTDAGLPADEFAVRPLPFEQRLTGGMNDWYVRYRYLSLQLHPNFARVEDAFYETNHGTFAKVEVVSDPRALAFAATLVWVLALSLELDLSTDQRRTGLGFQGDVDAFRDLGLALNAFTRDEPVKRDSPVYVPGPHDVGT